MTVPPGHRAHTEPTPRSPSHVMTPIRPGWVAEARPIGDLFGDKRLIEVPLARATVVTSRLVSREIAFRT
ncbi:MAG: hypothetical protein DLM60_12135 [Pseudonocardiales bacterium]|nr:MAG: hypothetical protein DLM60_12135 [Pseudonocardiales bacterium]